MSRVLAILGFHKIGEPPPGNARTWSYIPENTFVDQLSWLLESGWKVVDISAFLEGLRRPHALPERAAVLTFDDGYRSMREVALPHLERFGCPAVLFVPTGLVGGRNGFDAGLEPEEHICDWDELRALERAGVSVQSHGITHRAISCLEPREVEDELRRSKEAIETNLDKIVNVFAHPYGDEGADPEWLTARLGAAGYRAACLYGGGPIRLPVGDPYRLARVPMGPDTDLWTALATD